MDAPGFWRLVDHSREKTSDLREQRAWWCGRLTLLPAGEIADFAVRLDEQRRRVDTWAHWQAATLICHGWCGMDSFFYGHVRAFDVSPGGEEVGVEDPADIARRIPRLWALFGKAS